MGLIRAALWALCRLGLAAWLILLPSRASRPAPALPWPRAGVVMVGPVSAEALDALGPVWYYGYTFGGAALPGHVQVLMVRPHADERALRAALRARPGCWWLVGNEPNDPFQDNLSPGAYAAFYRRFEQLATRLDPTCRLAAGSLANADWRWAETFLASYRAQFGREPRVDAWNVHNYVLEPELDQLDVAEFKRRILAFRAWMATVGHGDRPLFLTEFGVLFGQPTGGRPAEEPERLRAYVLDTVTWLQATDHVQAWAWFSTNTRGQFNGDLYDDQGGLSPFGHWYREALLSSGAIVPDDAQPAQ